MKRSAFFSFFLLVSLFTQAQVNIDSLWGIWNDETAPDSSRAQAIHKIAWDGYLFSQPDSAFYFAQMQYDFANKMDLKKEAANALSTMGVSYYIRSDYISALDYYQRSLIIREEISDKRGIAGIYNNYGLIYSKQGDYPKALNYYQQSLKILEEINDKVVLASALNNIGKIYKNQGDYPNALNYYQRCFNIYEEINDKRGMAGILNNFGSIFMNQGNYPKALDYYQRSFKIREEISDKRGMAGALNNIGLIYMNREEYSKALDFYQQSLRIKEEISDKSGMSNTLNNIGLIFMNQDDYPKALDYYQRSLKIREEISDKRGVAGALNNIGEIYMNQNDYPKALEYYQNSLSIYEEITDKRGIAFTLNNIGKISNRQGDHAQAIIWSEKGLQISEEIDIIEAQRNACQSLYDAYKALQNDNKALEYHERITMLDDSLQAEETSKKLQQMEFAQQIMADSLIQEKEKLRVQIAHEAVVQKKNRTRNIYILYSILFLIVAVGLYIRTRIIRRAKTAIENEKDRSDKLLLNILPSEIAEELKEKGSADARNFEMVSILFTDFKEFTQTSEKLSAEELVGEINICFEPFDTICDKYGIEKIKTIGDSYMAAGGLPVSSDNSVKNTVLAGLEMTEFIIKRKQQREKEGNVSFEMRVGIHTGPVVAGIVGVKKFQYDIWGDTVNTASRMENSGEVGKVNISQSTYELIKEDPTFKFQSRGKIKAKGKGFIEMWFVEKIS
ncbi:tetratricopeptide repeat protein [Bacteroidota bacterium]